MASSKTSDVWKYMTISQIDKSVVSCSICKQKLKYACSSTSNLKKHLMRKHPIDYLGVEKPDESQSSTTTTTSKTTTTSAPIKKITSVLLQPTLKTTVERTMIYPRTSERKKDLDSMLMKMIVKDTQTLSIVDDEGFRAFVKALDRRYELPSRRHLTRELLPNLYEETSDSVKIHLASARHIAVTTDIWTARTTEAYITLTAHFVTEDFQMASIVLSTVHMNVDHTAVNIAEELRAIFDKWEIQEKVQAVVTDNAANMLAAVTQELKLRSVPCFAHSLNLVVQESIKRTEQIFTIKRRVKAIVSYFHHSVKAADRLRETQKQIKGQTKKLIQDVDTRWNSTAAMLKRYIEEHDAVTTTLCHMGRSELCMSCSEVEVMKSALESLEPFHLVTEEISSERKVTLSKMIPFVKLLQRSLTECQHPTFPLVLELQNQLRKRFSTLQDSFIAGAATFLDPRFKALHFTDKDAIGRTQERLREMISRAYNRDRIQEEKETAEETANETFAPPQKRKSIWDAHDEQVDDIIKRTPTQITGPQAELRRYQESPLLKRHEDPLEWWNAKKEMMPHLSKLAQQFLGIPATSVPAERLFSKAGELISARRGALKDTNVDKLLFLNKNVVIN